MVDILKVQEVVREAAKLFSNREASGQIKQKGDFDYVTAVDEAVQEYMKMELGKLYPEIQFIGEESDNSEVDWNGAAWVLDPVDGTTNLIHDYQNSAISLALMEKKELLLGVVYNPFVEEMYYAEKGKGSFLNGKRIFVSEAKKMKESLISVGTSPYYKNEADEIFKTFAKIYKDCQDLRRCGSAALDMAHVACGRIEAYTEKHLKIWDYAAATLLVREAGGTVIDYAGNDLLMEPMGNVIAGNSYIPEILAEKYLQKE